MSASTGCKVGRPAEKGLAPFQQASTKLHVEAWAGLLRNQGLQFSQEEEIVPGVCGRAVRCMLPLGFGRFMHLVVLCGYQGRIMILSSLL